MKYCQTPQVDWKETNTERQDTDRKLFATLGPQFGVRGLAFDVTLGHLLQHLPSGLPPRTLRISLYTGNLEQRKRLGCPRSSKKV